MLAMQMTVVHIVHMVGMQNGCVPTTGAVGVMVLFSLAVRSRRHSDPFSSRGLATVICIVIVDAKRINCCTASGPLLMHVSRLDFRSRPLVLTRVLQSETRTILLRGDRTLRPDCPLANTLAILNTGYCVGGVRGVSVPTANDGWEAHEVLTFAPVAAESNPGLAAKSKVC
jgi:hypothetical protein